MYYSILEIITIKDISKTIKVDRIVANQINIILPIWSLMAK